MHLKNWKSEKQEDIEYKALVCLDVNTRWNSTYLILESILKFKKLFEWMVFEDERYLCYFENDGNNNEGTPIKKWLKNSIIIC